MRSWMGAVVCLLISPAIAQEPFSREQRCIDVGWSEDFQDAEVWRPESWRVDRPDPDATATLGDDGIRFAVNTPGHAMLWTRTENPIWITDFPFLEIVYALEGAPRAEECPLLLLDDGTTGPITPGALNPENPEASGVSIRLGPLEPPGGRVVFDLADLADTDRIAQISLRVRSGEEPAALTVRRLVFRSVDPRERLASRPANDTQETLLPASTSPPRASDPAGQVSVALPTDGAISAGGLARALGRATDWPGPVAFVQGGIRFQLGDRGAAALATTIPAVESIDVAGRWRGHELALLLASRQVGKDGPSYGPQSGQPRRFIETPHRLLVELVYEQGARQWHFPWSLDRKRWSVGIGPESYVVPLDPERTLTEFRIHDRMNFGQVFLLAAKIVSSPAPPHHRPPVPEERMPSRSDITEQAPARIAHEGQLLTIQHGTFRIKADLANGLNTTAIELPPDGRNVIASEAAVRLLRVADENGAPVALRFVRLKRVPGPAGEAVEIEWTCGSADQERLVRLTVECSTDGAIRWTPSLVNQGRLEWKAALIFPAFDDIRISPFQDDRHYLLGTRGAVWGKKVLRVERPYGGTWPTPLIDVFAPRAGGGLGLFVADTELVPKTFYFQQRADTTRWSVSYPHLRVPAEGTKTLPVTVTSAHAGNWRATFARYRAWARAHLPPPGELLSKAFYCRRDYPAGGTGYLYDLRRGAYRPEVLLAESRRAFGGVDMIDISGWAMSRAVGRVGDYLDNDFGGLAGLDAMRPVLGRQGVHLGLYFEGYLIDRRAPVAEKALPAWQLIDAQGRGRWWPGEMEFFACPGVAAWRNALAGEVAEVARQSSASAVYLDQLGLCDPARPCWSADHGHPVPSNPLREERRLIEAVRRALDAASPGTALYVEYVPCDGMMADIDAAFDYGLTDRLGRPEAITWPMHHFVFPQLTVFEMAAHGVRPVPADAGIGHECLFYGLGMWLKGRADAWFTRAFRELASQAYPIFERHGEVFRAADCEPFLPTLRAGLYANRFTTDEKIIMTLYNTGWTSLTGDLFRTELPAGWEVVDLLADEPADWRREGASAVVRGTILPHTCSVYLLRRVGG